MALDPDFLDDSPYLPEGLFVDDILEIDHTGLGRIVLSAPTHEAMPLTRTQRAHPLRHPRHVAGGLIVHLTGIAGFAHAYYLLGLRHREGWIGYGAKVNRARFTNLARIGEPLVIDCRATQVRKGTARVLARYEFVFTQADTEVYRGDQTALFMKVEDTELAHAEAGGA